MSTTIGSGMFHGIGGCMLLFTPLLHSQVESRRMQEWAPRLKGLAEMLRWADALQTQKRWEAEKKPTFVSFRRRWQIGVEKRSHVNREWATKRLNSVPIGARAEGSMATVRDHEGVWSNACLSRKGLRDDDDDDDSAEDIAASGRSGQLSAHVSTTIVY
ncbi:unnamed protein product [Protopolystoma xenopodis]|uniref:Uncharacterized protein n=1 Tax=Protopolystoma xenopodis TaxID=117903 RepID=A0A3S5BA66_9PLAT|nr:unnamed protein product [Protopolystoma xenopodis]